jgi:polar amino acid transport system substrate-binding protein
MTDKAGADVLGELAPSGELVAAINFGNPVLAQRDAATGTPQGVSAELASELGRRLGVQVRFLTFETAGRVADSAVTGAWDLAFLAIDPQRAGTISFTAPYVVIEGAYMVQRESPLQAVEDVDRKGIRIAVGEKTAYDLFLTRTLKHAELVRAPSSVAALDLFLRDRLDCAAGVRQPLVQFAAAHPNLRVMAGRFMQINQAMAMPKGRPAAAVYLTAFIEEMKSSGFVAAALARSGQRDAQVAPASGQ